MPEPERHFVPFENALRSVLRRAEELRLGTETIPLDEALGRTLREDIVADEPFPSFANSAMDGFAVRAADVAGATSESPRRLRVIERVAAGAVPARALDAGEATRIMTGAPLPLAADAVVPIESTSAFGNRSDDFADVDVHGPVAAGENVRPAGEDFSAGERLAIAGRPIDAGVIGVMAALGHNSAEVSRIPRVAIISTGDELVPPGQPLPPGKIRDSNSHTLRALVRAAGASPGPTWHVADDPVALEAAVRKVLERCDVVVTIGGVSAGDFDPVRQALGTFADVELWRVGMRPGQPQAFGVVEGRLFFGLPGNPVSTAVVFEMLVRPALWTMMGRTDLDRPRVRATMSEAVTSKSGRRDFLRVTLATDATAPGGYRASLTGTQSSGAISSILRADGLAVVPDGIERVAPGDALEVLLWRSNPVGAGPTAASQADGLR